MKRGPTLIIAIFGLSLLAAGSSLWWRYVQTRPVLEFWGPEAANLITGPDKVEAMRLEPLDSDVPNAGEPGFLEVGSATYRISERRDVTHAPGFVNARHALVVRRSFQWDASSEDCQPGWRYALRFADAESAATVLFDFECKIARLADRDKTIGIAPIADGLQTVLDEQLKSAEATLQTTERGAPARKD